MFLVLLLLQASFFRYLKGVIRLIHSIEYFFFGKLGMKVFSFQFFLAVGESDGHASGFNRFNQNNGRLTINWQVLEDGGTRHER